MPRNNKELRQAPRTITTEESPSGKSRKKARVFAESSETAALSDTKVSSTSGKSVLHQLAEYAVSKSSLEAATSIPALVPEAAHPQQQLFTLTINYNKLMQKHQALETHVLSLVNSIIALISEKVTLQIEKSTLEQQLQTAAQHAAKLQSDLDENIIKASALSQQLSTHTDLIAKQDMQLQEKSKSIQELSKANAESDGKIQFVQNRLQLTQKKIQELELDLKAAQRQKVNSGNASSNHEIARLKDLISSNNRAYDAELQNMLAINAANKNTIAMLQHDLAVSQSIKKAQEDAILRLIEQFEHQQQPQPQYQHALGYVGGVHFGFAPTRSNEQFDAVSGVANDSSQIKYGW